MKFYPSREKYNPTPLLRAVQIFLLALILAGVVLLSTQNIWVPKVVQYLMKGENTQAVVEENIIKDSQFDFRNISFTLDGKGVTLVNGISEEQNTTESASKTVIRYFGNEAVGDLTGDDKPETAFLVTMESGGSGTFFYAVVAIKKDGGYEGTNAFLIGDRIAPQSNYIPENSQELQINYAERAPGEPMSTSPSQGATLILKINADGLLEGLMR